MDTELISGYKVHQGRNVRRLRQIMGIKQETLAEKLNISPSVLSRHEQKETIEDEILVKIAEAMNISPEAIRNYNDETAMNFISNTFTFDTTTNGFACTGCTFNPIDKIVELYNEKEKLYERMLKAEQERNTTLEKLLEEKK